MKRFVVVATALRGALDRYEPLSAQENARVLERISVERRGTEHGVRVPDLPPEPRDEAAVVWSPQFARNFRIAPKPEHAAKRVRSA